MKSNIILVFNILLAISFSCKTEEIILHGDITGTVSDDLYNQPINGASVKLVQLDTVTTTGTDGKYLFRNIAPGNHDIQASKSNYATLTKNALVMSAQIEVLDFNLSGIPEPGFSSSYLDYGLDNTKMNFTISNTGYGKLLYFLTSSKEWITVDPVFGEVTSETDTIKVTIDRTGLSADKYEEAIGIISIRGQDVVVDTLGIFLNGVMDVDGNYYKIVKIGSQTWMAENLNTGIFTDVPGSQLDNGVIDRYCYNNNINNCKIYGAIYRFSEAIQYRTLTTNQGICPDGWHIPNDNEWLTLINYLGGEFVAGGKLKEAGYDHWAAPNSGATNESGFSALPAGYLHPNALYPSGFQGQYWDGIGEVCTWFANLGSIYSIKYNSPLVYIAVDNSGADLHYSVRCIKNQ